MTHVLTEIADDAVATLTLDHERRRNALSHALVEEVLAALQAFRQAKARVVVLRARPGAKVFSAGHDVDELPEARRDPLGWDDPLRQLVRELEGFPAPVVAMVEGSVWGGATETVLACDLVVAAETASFAVTPAKLGVPYNAGGLLTFLNAAGLRLAKEMIFTAQPVDATRAERLGLVNRVVPGGGAGGGHLRPGAADRGQRAVERGGDEGAAADPGRGAPDDPAGLRAGAGLAAGGLRQRGLPGGDPRLQGEAPARLPGRVIGGPAFPKGRHGHVPSHRWVLLCRSVTARGRCT